MGSRQGGRGSSLGGPGGQGSSAPRGAGQVRPNANGTNGNGDLYKQLIDSNDMVKELDDIEAISQQISQHAEVLYNSWKSNGLGGNGVRSPSPGTGPGVGGPGFGALNGERSPGGPDRQYHSLRTDREGRVTNSQELGQEHRNGGGPAYHSLERGGRLPSSDSSPRHSSLSSPSSSTRESPQRGSSITHISANPRTESIEPLELLASPNLNGNLEDLVSSFVSTDRAKQAARNTISSSILRRIGSPNGSSSPVRSPSPTSSPLGGYKGSSSPLRSPMMTNMASPSPPLDAQSSPRSPSSMFNQSEATNRVAVGFLQSDVHAPMQSIFSHSPVSPPLQSSPLQRPSPPQIASATLPLHVQTRESAALSKTSPLHVHTAKVDPGDSIPIPVKHIPIAISPAPSPNPSHGLKSLTMLQNANKASPFAKPFQPSGEGVEKMSRGMEKMPNFFDEMGTPKDPEANLMSMRKRMEEAKQRMQLSLPAREGGIRPNSFQSMGRGGLFDVSPWGDDPSAFLLEQFRRRNKRRMEVKTDHCPH